MPRLAPILALLLCAASPVSAAPQPAVSVKLELLSRRLRVSQPLFIRISLKNGATTGDMVVSDWKFRGGDELYRDWLQASEGLGLDYIELLGPDGKPVQAGWYADLGPASPEPQDITIGEVDAETSSRAAVLRGQGLSPQEIERRLDEEQQRAEEARRQTRFPAHFVPPGASLRTVSFCLLKRGCPGKGFAQLPFDLTAPGRYKIRAVYAHEPDGAGAHDAWEIRAASQWIEFEVRR